MAKINDQLPLRGPSGGGGGGVSTFSLPNLMRPKFSTSNPAHRMPSLAEDMARAKLMTGPKKPDIDTGPSDVEYLIASLAKFGEAAVQIHDTYAKSQLTKANTQFEIARMELMAQLEEQRDGATLESNYITGMQQIGDTLGKEYFKHVDPRFKAAFMDGVKLETLKGAPGIRTVAEGYKKDEFIATSEEQHDVILDSVAQGKLPLEAYVNRVGAMAHTMVQNGWWSQTEAAGYKKKRAAEAATMSIENALVNNDWGKATALIKKYDAFIPDMASEKMLKEIANKQKLENWSTLIMDNVASGAPFESSLAEARTQGTMTKADTLQFMQMYNSVRGTVETYRNEQVSEIAANVYQRQIKDPLFTYATAEEEGLFDPLNEQEKAQVRYAMANPKWATTSDYNARRDAADFMGIMLNEQESLADRQFAASMIRKNLNLGWRRTLTQSDWNAIQDELLSFNKGAGTTDTGKFRDRVSKSLVSAADHYGYDVKDPATLAMLEVVAFDVSQSMIDNQQTELTQEQAAKVLWEIDNRQWEAARMRADIEGTRTWFDQVDSTEEVVDVLYDVLEGGTDLNSIVKGVTYGKMEQAWSDAHGGRRAPADPAAVVYWYVSRNYSKAPTQSYPGILRRTK